LRTESSQEYTIYSVYSVLYTPHIVSNLSKLDKFEKFTILKLNYTRLFYYSSLKNRPNWKNYQKILDKRKN
jgi:hypothetical protein